MASDKSNALCTSGNGSSTASDVFFVPLPPLPEPVCLFLTSSRIFLLETVGFGLRPPAIFISVLEGFPSNSFIKSVGFLPAGIS